MPPPEPGPAIDDRPGGPAAAVVVLVGGRARRFGGRDKTAARLGERSVLEGLLTGLRAGLPVEWPVLLVGTGSAGRDARLAEWIHRPLTRIQEQPSGGGPVAGLAAALAALPGSVRVILAFAGDQPFAAGSSSALLSALDTGEVDGRRAQAAVGVDPDGRLQPLLAAYRVSALRRALARGGPPDGRRLRDVLVGLRVVEVPVTAREALDVDTEADLERAHRLLGSTTGQLPEN